MTVQELIEKEQFEVVSEGDQRDVVLGKPFCCDLLSIAMSKAPVGCVWITVMANVNTLAVASLVEAACIILAEGVSFSEEVVKKARQQGITVLATKQSIYDTAAQIAMWSHTGA